MINKEYFECYINNLYDNDVPLVFKDGTDVYNNIRKDFLTHDKGYFIYGPSGCGKTHFVNRQKEKNWIDGDLLWSLCNAFPKGEWWNLPGAEIETIERRADVITEQAKNMGFWIIGASCVNIIPDAIVMPDLRTHLKYIKHREINNYDGGLTSENIKKIKEIRKYYSRHKKLGVPVFKSVDSAVNYLQNKYHSKPRLY